MKIKVSGFNNNLIVTYDSEQEQLETYIFGQAINPMTEEHLAPINELLSDYDLGQIDDTHQPGIYKLAPQQTLVFLINLFLKVSTNELSLIAQNTSTIKLSVDEKSQAVRSIAMEIIGLFEANKHVLSREIKQYYQNDFYPCFNKNTDCKPLRHHQKDQDNVIALLKWLEIKENNYNTIINKRSHHATDNQRLISLNRLHQFADLIQQDENVGNKYLMLVGCLLNEMEKTEAKHNSNGVISRFFTSSNLVDTYKSILKQQKQTLKDLSYDLDKEIDRKALKQIFTNDYGNHEPISANYKSPAP